MSARFIHADAVEIEDLGGGIKRQILGYGPELMAVRVWFDKGAIGQPHAHHHAQTSYVESGRFLATIAGEARVLEPGDAFFVEPNEMHGAVCLEPGVLIDMFCPMRADFVGIDDPAALPGRSQR